MASIIYDEPHIGAKQKPTITNPFGFKGAIRAPLNLWNRIFGQQVGAMYTRTSQTDQCKGVHFSTRRVAERYAKAVRQKGKLWEPIRCKAGHWHLNQRNASVRLVMAAA